MSKKLTINKANALRVFLNGNLGQYLEELRTQALDFVPDTTTAKGRKEIASRANLVAKHKVRVDTYGKNLVAGPKKKIKLIDGARKVVRDFLSEVKKEVRQSLTEWEEIEKEKQKQIDGAIEAAELEHRDASRIVFTVPSKEARDLVYDNITDECKYNVIKKTITATSRWSIHYRVVVQRKEDGLFFEVFYTEGATENQPERAFEYNDAKFEQVFKEERTVYVYV